MRKVALLLAVSFICSCSPEKALEIEQVQIITRDPERLANWYRENLEFRVSKNRLYQSNFKIHLKKNEDAASTETLKEVFRLQQVPGFYKLGFITNQFAALAQHFKNNKVQMVSGIVFDQVVQKRTFVVKDPDGNHIQLFEGFGRDKLKPYYLAVIVESIGEQEKWYQMKLPVLKTHNRDVPDQKVYVRLLEGKDFLIELIDTSGESVKKELDKHERLGFSSVTIRGASTVFDKDHEGNKIVHQ